MFSTNEIFVQKSFFFQNIICVATLALGSRPRQGFARERPGVWESENEHSHSQMNFDCVGGWSPGGLPKIQRTIAKVKTPRLMEFFISLESY
jgi:hypothetical protein